MKYEYLERKNLSIAQVNTLGKEGWRLIQVVQWGSHVSGYASSFYFERPLSKGYTG